MIAMYTKEEANVVKRFIYQVESMELIGKTKAETLCEYLGRWTNE